MSMEQHLGKLICQMNPYTEMPKFNMGAALKTGEMDIYLNNPAPGKQQGDISQVPVELEGNYGAQWSFNGQPQNVKTALRIRYRFPVQDKDGNHLYWVTEHLLVGYVGSGGE